MNTRLRRLFVLMPFSVCFLEGCPAASPVGTLQPTYSSIARNVFVGCSTQSCHGSLGRRGNLVLTPDVAYANLVGQPSDNDAARADGLLRVAAGHPETSFLLLKLTGPLKPGYGDRMPQHGTPLDPGTIAAIRAWIASGAPND